MAIYHYNGFLFAFAARPQSIIGKAAEQIRCSLPGMPTWQISWSVTTGAISFSTHPKKFLVLDHSPKAPTTSFNHTESSVCRSGQFLKEML